MVPEVLVLFVHLPVCPVDRPDGHHVLIVLSKLSKPLQFRKNGLGRIRVCMEDKIPDFPGFCLPDRP